MREHRWTRNDRNTNICSIRPRPLCLFASLSDHSSGRTHNTRTTAPKRLLSRTPSETRRPDAPRAVSPLCKHIPQTSAATSSRREQTGKEIKCWRRGWWEWGEGGNVEDSTRLRAEENEFWEGRLVRRSPVTLPQRQGKGDR